MLKPRFISGGCCVEAFLALEVEFAFGGAEAHAGEVVGDDAQACHAFEIVVPFRRIVAVHAVEVGEQHVVVSQGRFDFGGALQCAAQRPLRWNASVNHGDIALLVVVHELLLAYPLQQFRAVRGIENLAQGVGLLQALDISSRCQQMQVVVTEHADQRFTHAI
ncbi:hypothetical protein D3C81_1587690 [compost metagenome]